MTHSLQQEKKPKRCDNKDCVRLLQAQTKAAIDALLCECVVCCLLCSGQLLLYRTSIVHCYAVCALDTARDNCVCVKCAAFSVRFLFCFSPCLLEKRRGKQKKKAHKSAMWWLYRRARIRRWDIYPLHRSVVMIFFSPPLVRNDSMRFIGRRRWQQQ